MSDAKVKTGDKAPDFTLPSVNGETVSLADALHAQHNVLLAFGRHLGWPASREHVAQLCHQQDELKRLNTAVLVISFSNSTEKALAWLKEICPSFTMLLDLERKVYRAYGLKRSWIRVGNPIAAWDYIKLLLSGQRVRGIEADPYQLGGDFIVDSRGFLRLVYRSRVATDFPSMADLLDILGKLHQESEGSKHG